MFKLYVCWPNGTGYTKDVRNYREIIDELTDLAEGDEPIVVNITYLEDEVVEVDGERRDFGGVQVGQSAVHGTKVRD